MNETEAAEKARGKADLDAKEAANKSEFLTLHTTYALKYKDRLEQITLSITFSDMNNSSMKILYKMN